MLREVLPQDQARQGGWRGEHGQDRGQGPGAGEAAPPLPAGSSPPGALCSSHLTPGDTEGGSGDTVRQARLLIVGMGDLGWRRRGSLPAAACLSLSVLSPREFQLYLFFQEALCHPGLWRA